MSMEVKENGKAPSDVSGLWGLAIRVRASRGGGEARQEARYPNNFRHSSLKKLSKTGM